MNTRTGRDCQMSVVGLDTSSLQSDLWPTPSIFSWFLCLRLT